MITERRMTTENVLHSFFFYIFVSNIYKYPNWGYCLTCIAFVFSQSVIYFVKIPLTIFSYFNKGVCRSKTEKFIRLYSNLTYVYDTSPWPTLRNLDGPFLFNTRHNICV